MFKYLPAIATAQIMFAASEKAVEEFVVNSRQNSLKIISHMKRNSTKNNHQKITDPDQSGASACILSFDYNLQGISHFRQQEYFTNMLKTFVCCA